MYAKLVVGNTTIPTMDAIRDICRLLTSESPSTALLQSFNTTTSIIFDNTPAGWTYVGGSDPVDQPAISNATGTFSTTRHNLAIKAPIKDYPDLYKFCVFTQATSHNSAAASVFSLTGATNASPTGVITNEGPRWFSTNTTASDTVTSNLQAIAGQTLYIIADQRHVTIVKELNSGNRAGLYAVWETNMTDAHKFHNKPAFVQFSKGSSGEGTYTVTGLTYPASSGLDNSQTLAGVFDVVDVNTNISYGVVFPGFDVDSNKTSANTMSLIPTGPREKSINQLGQPTYQLSPIFFHLNWLGYPVQYVTGTVPIYFMAGNAGNSQDEVEIGDDTYTYFNCGPILGVAIKV